MPILLNRHNNLFLGAAAKVLAVTRKFFAFWVSATRNGGDSSGQGRGALTQFVARDRFDKRDDASPQVRLLNLHESLDEHEPIYRREEVGQIGGRRSLFNFIGLDQELRRAFEEERHWDLQDMRCRRLAPMRFVPLSYFCTCWNVGPRPSASFSWLIPSIFRAIRTRLPTCLSTGLGAF